MCCCGKNRSVRCQRENHCYKKCPSTKAGGGNGQPFNAYIASASSSSSATIVADMGALIGHDDGAQMEPFTSAVAILQTAAAGIKATQGTGLSKAVASVVKEAGQLLDVAVAQVTAYAQNHKAASHSSISVPASGYTAPSSFSPFTGASMLNAACLRAAAFHRQKGKVSMEEAREMEGKDSDGNDICDEYDDDSDGSSGTRMTAESHTGDDSSDESSDFHQGRGQGARGGRRGRGGRSGKGKGSKRRSTYEDDEAYVDEEGGGEGGQHRGMPYIVEEALAKEIHNFNGEHGTAIGALPNSRATTATHYSSGNKKTEGAVLVDGPVAIDKIIAAVTTGIANYRAEYSGSKLLKATQYTGDVKWVDGWETMSRDARWKTITQKCKKSKLVSGRVLFPMIPIST